MYCPWLSKRKVESLDRVILTGQGRSHQMVQGDLRWAKKPDGEKGSSGAPRGITGHSVLIIPGAGDVLSAAVAVIDDGNSTGKAHLAPVGMTAQIIVHPCLAG